jgi:hypothetical protein
MSAIERRRSALTLRFHEVPDLNLELETLYCAVCTIFSYEATIYECGLLDMRILPFSYPPTPFPSPSPPLAVFRRTQDHYRAGVRSGNFPWKFGLASFLNFVSAPGGVPRHRGLPTRRPRGKP